VALRLGLVDEASNEPPRYLTNGKVTIGIVADRAPSPAQARRLVVAAAPSFAEVVTLDTVEGLMIHPDRMGKLVKLDRECEAPRRSSGRCRRPSRCSRRRAHRQRAVSAPRRRASRTNRSVW